MTDSTDHALLQRARDGDKDALTELLHLYDAEVRLDVQRRLPQRWQSLLSVDDVLQQTYAKTILAIRRFVPSGVRAFPAWLKKLAQFHLIEAIRALEADKRGGAARKLEPRPGSDSYTALFEQLTGIGTQTTPSRGAIRAEQRQALQAALAQLPEHYHLVVRRYDLEGCAIDEIATEMQRSPGAVHLLRVRAHARLRELLEQRGTIF